MVPAAEGLPSAHSRALSPATCPQEQRSGRNGGLWVLKENAHRGKGVGVVTPPAALARALQRAPSGGVRHVLAQRFVDNQLLIDGRPFYIRCARRREHEGSPQAGAAPRKHSIAWAGHLVVLVGALIHRTSVHAPPSCRACPSMPPALLPRRRLWAVLMGAAPARVYLFDGGVVVFGQQQRAGQSNDALIVNLWTQDRAAAAPWSLGQLETYLAAQSGSGGGSDGGPGGADAVRRLRARLHSSVAATLAAALPNVRRSTSALPGFQGGSFEVLGVDFLVDASLRPWLVEVNFLPSMARKLVGCNASSSAAATGSRSDGGASGASSTGRSPRRGPGSCQQDNPFDVQKEKFMRALLGLLTQRHSQLSPAQQQAQQLLLDMSAAAGEGEAAPCVDAAQLRQVAALRGEQAAAESLGFVPLTEVMYRCLECAAGGQLQLSGESLESEPAEALSGNGACAVLAELAPPPDGTGQQEAQRQCDAPGGAAQQLVARLQRWRERLLLEGAALAPWVLNPRARWRATSRPPAPQSIPMSPADRRVLAWLRRGLPPLDSQQAVRDFCAAAA